MRYSLAGLLVVAASFNMALGAPISEEKTRSILAREAVRRSIENNPYIQTENTVARRAPHTPKKIRSVLNLLKRNPAPYKYTDTPADKRSVENLGKRSPYKYTDTPADKRSVENLDKRYKYTDTPADKRSVDDLHKRYRYTDTPADKRSVEDLSARSPYKYTDTPADKRSLEDLSARSPYKYTDTPADKRSLEDLSKREE
jgi:hypothetical protein